MYNSGNQKSLHAEAALWEKLHGYVTFFLLLKHIEVIYETMEMLMTHLFEIQRFTDALSGRGYSVRQVTVDKNPQIEHQSISITLLLWGNKETPNLVRVDRVELREQDSQGLSNPHYTHRPVELDFS